MNLDGKTAIAEEILKELRDEMLDELDAIEREVGLVET